MIYQISLSNAMYHCKMCLISTKSSLTAFEKCWGKGGGKSRSLRRMKGCLCIVFQIGLELVRIKWSLPSWLRVFGSLAWGRGLDPIDRKTGV